MSLYLVNGKTSTVSVNEIQYRFIVSGNKGKVLPSKSTQVVICAPLVSTGSFEQAKLKCYMSGHCTKPQT